MTGVAGKSSPQLPQVAVIGAELVTPLGDAVGLVDGDEAEVQAVEEAAEPGEGQPLRGHVEQLDLTPQDLPLHAPYLPGG